MRRVRIKKYKNVKRTLIVAVAGFLVYGMFLVFNRCIEPQLNAFARQHAGFAINNIVKQVINNLEYDPENLYKTRIGENGEITQVVFDSYQLNQLLYEALDTIDTSLKAAQDGKKDPVTQSVYYEDGIVYEIPIGSLSNIFFLANKGPKLKVHIRMFNDVGGEIETKIEPYGVNSSLVSIILKVEIEAEAITMMSITPFKESSEIPLVVQVISGKVPSYNTYKE